MHERHIYKHTFFTLIRNRLFRLAETIMGRMGIIGVVGAVDYNAEQMKRILDADDYIGKGFWGYGINRICDGNVMFTMPDVEEIKKLPELNKHHQPYRQLAVLTFKIESDSIYVSTFAIDSVAVGINSRINTRYRLDNFENAQMVTINHRLHVEFIFKGLEHPISFQVDDYYVPGYLTSSQVAKYYIDGIKNEVHKFQQISVEKPFLTPSNDKEEETKERIHKVEELIRTYVAMTLQLSTGKEKYEQILPSQMKRIVAVRIKELSEINPATNPEDFSHLDQAIQFCDIEQLKSLITNEKHWPHFEPVFRSIEKAKNYLTQFNSFRNAVMHNREIPKLISHEGEAAIEWLNGILVTSLQPSPAK